MTTLLIQNAFALMLSVCATSGTTPECVSHAAQLRVFQTEAQCNRAGARMPTVGGYVIGFDQALYRVAASN
jgi:hypothetical protein